MQGCRARTGQHTGSAAPGPPHPGHPIKSNRKDCVRLCVCDARVSATTALGTASSLRWVLEVHVIIDACGVAQSPCPHT